MTKVEALTLLDTAPVGDSPARVNPGLTKTQCVKIVRDAIKARETPNPLDHLMEKRVWQVVKNQRRPKF